MSRETAQPREQSRIDADGDELFRMRRFRPTNEGNSPETPQGDEGVEYRENGII